MRSDATQAIHQRAATLRGELPFESPSRAPGERPFMAGRYLMHPAIDNPELPFDSRESSRSVRRPGYWSPARSGANVGAARRVAPALEDPASAMATAASLSRGLCEG